MTNARQNRFLRAPLRRAAGVLDPARPGMTRAFRLLTTEGEDDDRALYDHIQQLRAELRGCSFTRRERAAVQAELATAIAAQAELDQALDSALASLQNPAQAIGAAA
jgi:hypothetical protein